MKIESGTGNGKEMRVSEGNRALTSGIAASPRTYAAFTGDAYNINTGLISISTNAANGIIYLKNDESPFNGESRIYVQDIAFGIGESNGATLTDEAQIKVIKNPTTGTLISDANAVAMKSNNNFGSSQTLSTTTLAYAASATNKTVTDGTDHALLIASESTTLGVGNRLFATLDIVLERGSCMAITYDPGHTTAHNVYCALLIWRVPGKLELSY
jgi:hypothetical protein